MATKRGRKTIFITAVIVILLMAFLQSFFLPSLRIKEAPETQQAEAVVQKIKAVSATMSPEEAQKALESEGGFVCGNLGSKIIGCYETFVIPAGFSLIDETWVVLLKQRNPGVWTTLLKTQKIE